MTTALGDRSITGVLLANEIGTANRPVQKLYVNEIFPPVGGGNLQEACDLGNTTTTDINMIGGSLKTTNNIVFMEERPIYIESQFQDSNMKIGFKAGAGQENPPETTDAIAIGNESGSVAQNSSCIAIGSRVGQKQSFGCIAIGGRTGLNQGEGSIAMGRISGNEQETDCVSIGSFSGSGGTQAKNSVCIGMTAGGAGCSRDSVMLGGFAGATGTGQGNNIVINGTGVDVSPFVLDSGALFIAPIRGGTNPAGGVANTLWYDILSKEVRYHVP